VGVDSVGSLLHVSGVHGVKVVVGVGVVGGWRG